jgi:hypothetical protein
VVRKEETIPDLGAEIKQKQLLLEDCDDSMRNLAAADVLSRSWLVLSLLCSGLSDQLCPKLIVRDQLLKS